MNLNQVTIPVTKMKEAIDFYTCIGLTLIVHTHDRYARFVCPDGNATLSLHLVETISPDARTTIYFERKDLDQYIEILKDKGIKFDTQPKDQTWLWREAHLSDPDGNPIIIYYAGENRIDPPWKLKS